MVHFSVMFLVDEIFLVAIADGKIIKSRDFFMMLNLLFLHHCIATILMTATAN